MTKIEKLLSIASDHLGPQPNVRPDWLMKYSLGPELFGMLQKKNGFYAFELALHVFPLLTDPATGLEAWNSTSLWRGEYQDLADGLLFFAEDVFQDQFCISESQDGVRRFYAETGRTLFMAQSIDEWAGVILENYLEETGWPLLREWQGKNGALPIGKRLMPKTPFFLGGKYNLENLWAGDALEGMRFKADLAIQTRDLPDGAQVKINMLPRTK